MSDFHNKRVLGRVMARDLTEREAESVGGAYTASGCGHGTFVSEISSEGTPVCDPVGQRRSP